MLWFTRGTFDPLVSFIEAVTASYFMLYNYGEERMTDAFAKKVVMHVADAVRTQEISFEVLSQHLQIDRLRNRTVAYGMWPISRSQPPLPVRAELFDKFMKLNGLESPVDDVIIADS